MRLKAAVTAVIATTLAWAAPASSAGGRAASQVEIKDYLVDGDKAIFIGRVTSPSARCAGRGRQVKVIGYDTGGPERVFGSDKTNAKGKFKVSEPIPFAEDFAYAKVKRTPDCRGDRSKPVSTAG